MVVAADALSLAELERHDPQAPARGMERRFLCPFPRCGDKQNPHRHRSLAVNTETGAYYCHRCQERGLLADKRDGSRPERPDHRARLRRAFAVAPQPKPATTAPLEDADTIGVPVAESAVALAYLRTRGIPAELATAATLRFVPAWGAHAGLAGETGSGSPAIVFPMRDQAGAHCAAHGRALQGPGKLTRGPTSAAVFATPGAIDADVVALTEGPMDALSLALCGVPALAMIGTNLPAWLCRRTYSRQVLVATDADVAGDEAAARIERACASYGADVRRLRPPHGVKDWNEALQLLGPESMRQLLDRGLRGQGPVDPEPDPREDLAEDSLVWAALLSRVHDLEGDVSDGLFGALHGARCGGARLVRSQSGTILVAGDWSATEYAEFRRLYLLPRARLLTAVLRTLS